MLTMVLLMRALDPLLHEQETDLYLEKLTQVDCYRQGYYRDLSKFSYKMPDKGPFTHAIFDAIFVALSNATFVASVN